MGQFLKCAINMQTKTREKFKPKIAYNIHKKKTYPSNAKNKTAKLTFCKMKLVGE